MQPLSDVEGLQLDDCEIFQGTRHDVYIGLRGLRGFTMFQILGTRDSVVILEIDRSQLSRPQRLGNRRAKSAHSSPRQKACGSVRGTQRIQTANPA